jgi:multidrug efflux pump subunit AcrA (membrane-fusion protein)
VVLKNADVRPDDPAAFSGGAAGEPADAPENQAQVTAVKPVSGWRSLVYRPYRVGRNWSVTQVAGGLLIAAVCAAAVVWYVPRIVSTNRRALTGSVTSSGILTLNFQNPGVISVIKVEPNEAVHRGQVLAVEYAPTMGALIGADNAAIGAVQAKIAQLKSDEVIYPLHAPADQAQVASENAQMAGDQARLEADREKLAETEIIAPSAGVVVAANGQPGESVTSSGIHNYSSTAPAQGSQGPAFSLLPEGPQSYSHAAASQSSLPVIALRVSSSWSVVAYVPENSVSAVRSGERVTVSVPAAGIKNVRGSVLEMLPDPVQSSSGLLYQAVISISGSVSNPPLNDMAANIELDR